MDPLGSGFRSLGICGAHFGNQWSRSFIKHLVWSTSRKAHNLLWTCRRVCRMGWVLGPKVVHWLYVTIVWPTVSYASLVWWPGCQTASTKNKLSKVPRLACLGITGAFRTTTGTVEVLVGLPPLDLVIEGEARSAAHRLWSLGVLVLPSPPTRAQLHIDST